MSGEGNLGEDVYILSNGVKMPAFGLGTFRVRHPDDIYTSVDEALNAGYRLFDTAAVYQNEAALGRAFKKLLPKHGLTRQDIFVTTKLSNSDLAGPLVQKAFQRSLDNLGFDYVDLYLIHFPGAVRLDQRDTRNAQLRVDVWKEFEKLYKQGKAKTIGVSNFTVKHLTHLAEFAEIQPMVNQVEWHPHYYQLDLLQYCESHNIRLQAYCPFGGLAHGYPSLFEETPVRELSQKHQVSACQVLLAWILQRGISVTPKSTNPQHIISNIQINIRLSPDDISRLDSLIANGRKYAWNPESIA